MLFLCVFQVQVTYIDLATKRKGHRCNSLTETCSTNCCEENKPVPVVPLIEYDSAATSNDNSAMGDLKRS